MTLWLGPLAETFLLQGFILLHSTPNGASLIFFISLMSFFIYLPTLFPFSTRTSNILIIGTCLTRLFVFILNNHLSMFFFFCFVLCAFCITWGVLGAFQTVDLFSIKLWESSISSIFPSPSKTPSMSMLDGWILSRKSMRIGLF